MSLYATGEFGYLQQIEAYFLSYSRVGVMLSSLDTELIRQWRQDGVPVEAVCTGIKQTFDNFDEPPRSIHQCRHHIDSAIKAWLSHQSNHPESADNAPRLPGRDLPDPTRLNKRRRSWRKADAISKETSQETADVPDDEVLLRCWYRSMSTLVEAGHRDALSDLTRDVYRWAYRQMLDLRQRALKLDDSTRLVTMLPLAIGEIEAGMYDLAFQSLDQEAQSFLEQHFSPEMRSALKHMSPEARHRQLFAWRRRVMEDILELKPFFTP